MRLLPVLLLCLAGYSPLVLAVPVADLYQVREPLAADTDAEQGIALSAAFDTLLLRLTPGPRTAGDPALSALRQNPRPLIVRYNKREAALNVEFDPRSTLRTLREQGLPLWTGERPLLLLWWREKLHKKNSVMLLGDAQPGSEVLVQASRHRALPVLLPLADLPEQLLVPEQDFAAWQQATARYRSDGLLEVDVTGDGRQLEASWRLHLGEEEESGTARGKDRESLADMLLLEVSQRLAKRFAVAPPTEGQELTLEIRGANLNRYAELVRAFEPFSARLLQMDGDKLLWQLNAPAETVRAHLSLMRLRELSADEMPAEAADGRLYFRW